MDARASTDFVIGTYDHRGGRGLVPVRFDAATDGWQVGEPIRHIRNASFGVRSRKADRYYFTDEREDGRIVVHAGPAEHWRELASVGSGGAGPCHIALSEDETRLAIANYDDGRVAVIALDPASGLPIGPAHVHQNEGGGPDRERQTGPHAHWVGFHDRRLLAVDLGADRIFAYPEDGDSSQPAVAYAAPAGSGPRHLALQNAGEFAFLVGELASTLTVLHAQDDGFVALQSLSTLPSGYTGKNLAGAIAVNAAGTLVHVSNRGRDSIVTFAIDAAGQARVVREVPSAGSSPRHMLLLEEHRRLLVAHEKGGGVGIFPLDDQGCPLPREQALDLAGSVFIQPVG